MAVSLKAWKEPVQMITVQYCEETKEESAEEVTDLPLYPITIGGSNVYLINHELTLGQKDALNSLLDEFKEVLSIAPGRTMTAEHTITTGDSPPVYHPPYRVHKVWEVKVRSEISTMLKAEDYPAFTESMVLTIGSYV